MAKRQIDKSLQEQQDEMQAGFARRMENISNLASGAFDTARGVATGIVKEEIFGIPGLLGDLAEPLQAITTPGIYGLSPELQEATKDFQEEFGASGLAAKAGIELSDEFLDEEGELRPEMAGRLVAPGALYVKGAQLIPALSKGVGKIAADAFNMTPRPAVAGGPSPMTQAPSDAGPSTTVSMTEAPGTPTGGAPKASKVQEEKEQLFVSPDNEGVRGGAPQTAERLFGLTFRTGVYHPLFGATQIVKQASGAKELPANKLLEKLRGQPRAGSELKATGIDEYLKRMGTTPIRFDDFDKVLETASPEIQIKVVVDGDSTYEVPGGGIIDLPDSDLPYTGMQRQANSEDTEYLNGAILFGDKSAAITGADGRKRFFPGAFDHEYYDRFQKGNFGHVRFSIQDVVVGPDNQPLSLQEASPIPGFINIDQQRTLKAFVVEEIQSDLIKAVARYQQGLKRELEAGTSLSSAKKKAVKMADDITGGSLGGRTPFGVDERLGLARLQTSDEYKKLKELEDREALAGYADGALSSASMNEIDARLKAGYSNIAGQGVPTFTGAAGTFAVRADIDEVSADVDKFILLNDLYKAKTEAELDALLDSLPENDFPFLQASVENDSNLTLTEKKLRRKEQIKEKVQSVRSSAARSRRKEQDALAESSGISGILRRAMPAKDVETDMNEKALRSLRSTLVSSVRKKHAMRQAKFAFDKNQNALIDARRVGEDEVPGLTVQEQNPIDAASIDDSTYTVFNNVADLEDRNLTPKERGNGPVLKRQIGNSTVRKILGDDPMEVKFAEENAQMELEALEKAAPVFRDISNVKELFLSGSVRPIQMMPIEQQVVDVLGGETPLEEFQLRTLRENILKDIANAKDQRPSAEELKAARKAIRRDPELSSAADIVDLTPDELFNTPPLKTQNDFIQFATRVIPGEAKRLGADIVIFPPVEEFAGARVDDLVASYVGGDLQNKVPGNKLEFSEMMLGRIKGEKEGLILSNVLKGKKYKDENITLDMLKEAGKDTPNALKVIGGLIGDVDNSRFQEGSNNPITGAELGAIIGDRARAEAVSGGKDNIGRYDDKTYIISKAKFKGHLQNYGDSLDAGIAKIANQGFDVSTPSPQLTLVNKNKGITTTLGSYSQQDPTGLNANAPRYRIVNVQEGTPSGELAKKVPSLYNKGGAVKSGIGGMARRVM